MTPYKQVETLLNDAESITNDNAKFPCTRHGNIGCMRVQFDKGRAYDTIKEAELCMACACHWHIARARFYALRLNRIAAEK